MGFMGGTANSFPFDNVGDTVTGYVVAEPEEMDQTDQDTGEVKTWANGQAKKVWKIRLLTELRDPDDPFDEGERTIWIKWKSLDAVRKAVRAAGAKDIEVGGKLQLCFSDETPMGRGKNPAKEWTARYAPPPPGSKSSGLMDSGSTKKAAPENLEEQRTGQKSKGTVLDKLKAAGFTAEPVGDGFGDTPPF